MTHRHPAILFDEYKTTTTFLPNVKMSLQLKYNNIILGFERMTQENFMFVRDYKKKYLGSGDKTKRIRKR